MKLRKLWVLPFLAAAAATPTFLKNSNFLHETDGSVSEFLNTNGFSTMDSHSSRPVFENANYSTASTTGFIGHSSNSMDRPNQYFGDNSVNLHQAQHSFGLQSQNSTGFGHVPNPMFASLGPNHGSSIWPGPTMLPPPVYMPTSNLAEVIRFDVYPVWVRTRWDRVTHTPGDEQMDGLRVAWVSGSLPHDLAGTLTYYFDKHQQVQKVTFLGWTGDPSQLAQFVQSQYGLRQEPSKSAGLYIKKKFGNLHSIVRFEYAPVMSQTNLNQHFHVYMELNHPKSNLRLSDMGLAAASNN
ncbi:MAG TPA: hypothetical protein PKD64_05920 [Pirellulaceae bacterium]|nr:hypothetical protein [Pirellulaceae bacterium]HMO91716.1 hypothetical protein [Pirellulaceae bacterium]HMP69821.1 hypothetical protein [Pirellulaceae bacterium]